MVAVVEAGAYDLPWSWQDRKVCRCTRIDVSGRVCASYGVGDGFGQTEQGDDVLRQFGRGNRKVDHHPIGMDDHKRSPRIGHR